MLLVLESSPTHTFIPLYFSFIHPPRCCQARKILKSRRRPIPSHSINRPLHQSRRPQHQLWWSKALKLGLLMLSSAPLGQEACLIQTSPVCTSVLTHMKAHKQQFALDITVPIQQPRLVSQKTCPPQILPVDIHLPRIYKISTNIIHDTTFVASPANIPNDAGFLEFKWPCLHPLPTDCIRCL